MQFRWAGFEPARASCETGVSIHFHHRTVRLNCIILAESVGFEPTVPLQVQHLSRVSQSATLSRLRKIDSVFKLGLPWRLLVRDYRKLYLVIWRARLFSILGPLSEGSPCMRTHKNGASGNGMFVTTIVGITRRHKLKSEKLHH